MDKTPDASGSTPDAQSTTETTMTTGHTMSQTPQRILITGGASGLGRAMAEAWLRDGARVLIGDVNQERAAETLAALKDLPGELQFQYLDVRDAASFNNAREWLEQNWGGLDVLVNNAGVAGAARIDRGDMADWDWIFDINVKGVVRGCKVFVPMMKRQGHGHIVNIASLAGLLHAPVMGSYNVTKAGVISLSETLRFELAPYGIIPRWCARVSSAPICTSPCVPRNRHDRNRGQAAFQ
ncbi:SDR family NAD(P)-dependent oxidoreductase [Alcanivorax sp.]|uniref:SDR family NAD(P)-dependent oxidoreductase n=1 Tax=Alcanivorax sp. TaxID=1872427 RepID=UPI003BAB2C8D